MINKKLAVILIALISTLAIAAGFKSYSWDELRFGGSAAGVRSIVFDQNPDGNSATISVDPADEEININNKVVLDNGLDVSGRLEVISTTEASKPCPEMTTAQKDAIPTPGAGDCVYDTDLKALNTYDATTSRWVSAGSGGGGSSGINFVTDASFENEILLPDFLAGGTATYPEYTEDDDLFGEFNKKYFSVSYTGLSSANLYVRDTFARTGLDNKSGLFHIRVKATGSDLKLCFSIDDSDFSEPCLDNLEYDIISDGTFHYYPVPMVFGAASTEYSIYNASASGNYTIALEEVYIGTLPTGYVQAINDSDTDYISYTPTFTGFGTVTGVDMEYKRVGDSMLISGRFSCGTSTAVEARVSLPLGLEVKSGSGIIARGAYFRGQATNRHGGAVLTEGGESYLTFGDSMVFGGDVTNALIKDTGNVVCGTGNALSFTTGLIPIEGWETGRVDALGQKFETPFVRGGGNATEVLTSGTSDIPFIELQDGSNIFDGTVITAKEKGFYIVTGSQHIASATADLGIYYYIGGAQGRRLGYSVSATRILPFAGIVPVESGEELSFRNNRDVTLTNNITNHHIHVQFFPTTVDVIGLFKDTQIKKVEDKYTETEKEWGMWNGEQLYRRCFTVSGDKTNGTTIATFGTNIKPKNTSKISGADTWLVGTSELSFSASDYQYIELNATTGVIKAVVSASRRIYDKSNHCIEYTK